MVFDDITLKEYLGMEYDEEVVKLHMERIRKSRENSEIKLPRETENAIAKCMFEWAKDNDAVNFAHWAHPMRGPTPLLKHDTFLELDFDAKTDNKPMRAGFSASRLFQNETDGSSFPNGGLRSTHRAAAYMGWDRTSPPFIRGDTVYIPSAFISWNGDALDEKTPLLRSQRAIKDAGMKLLPHLPGTTKKEQAAGIICNVGWEQEFFLIDRDDFVARPDLVQAGRTVLGAAPSRGQQTSINYFAPMHPRAKRILERTQATLLELGCPFAVYHNEVAPAQHEMSPIFRIVNEALDHNVLAMEILKLEANKEGMVALTHEKPFRGINGSGKHLNWGLNVGSSGRNLFTPGKTEPLQESFMTMVAVLVRAVNLHGDSLRAAVASAGNDHRLGAHEAPPAIISLYLGEEMMKHIETIMNNGGPLHGYGRKTTPLDFGTSAVAKISASMEDRNRTAPFPFCGNRFELRAQGSDGNIAMPLTVVQTAVAESILYLVDKLQNGKIPLRDAVAEIFKENQRIIFNGNGYSKEWHEEAVKRGLPNLKQSVDAYRVLKSNKAKELFNKMNVLKPHELDARVQILYETHVETVMIEANALLDMLCTGVIPACAQDLKGYEGTATTNGLAGARPELYTKLAKLTEQLETAIDELPNSDDIEVVAKYTQDVIRPKMNDARFVADQCERLIRGDLYPYPTYGEMFYTPQSEAVEY
jgi:glutamine synthetase